MVTDDSSKASSGPDPSYVFGRYHLIRRLGEGGMASVYLAHMEGQDGFRKKVAIKIIHPNVAAQARFLEWFKKEARLGGLLAHANIVGTLDYGYFASRPYLAMDYVDGPTLYQLISLHRELNRPIPLDIAIGIVLEVCAGLDYAHGATDLSGKPLRMVHRDLKPSNILVARDGTVKIVDFGVARSEAGDRTAGNSSLKGTLRYMSPEQAQSSPDLDGRSDLFCLGLVMFELLTLHPLYDQNTEIALIHATSAARIGAALDRLPLNLPFRPSLLSWFRKAMAFEPENRFSSGNAMAQELLPMLSGLPHRMTLRNWLEETLPLFAQAPEPLQYSPDPLHASGDRGIHMLRFDWGIRNLLEEYRNTPPRDVSNPSLPGGIRDPYPTPSSPSLAGRPGGEPSIPPPLSVLSPPETGDESSPYLRHTRLIHREDILTPSLPDESVTSPVALAMGRVPPEPTDSRPSLEHSAPSLPFPTDVPTEKPAPLEAPADRDAPLPSAEDTDSGELTVASPPLRQRDRIFKDPTVPRPPGPPLVASPASDIEPIRLDRPAIPLERLQETTSTSEANRVPPPELLEEPAPRQASGPATSPPRRQAEKPTRHPDREAVARGSRQTRLRRRILDGILAFLVLLMAGAYLLTYKRIDLSISPPDATVSVNGGPLEPINEPLRVFCHRPLEIVMAHPDHVPVKVSVEAFKCPSRIVASLEALASLEVTLPPGVKATVREESRVGPQVALFKNLEPLESTTLTIAYPEGISEQKEFVLNPGEKRLFPVTLPSVSPSQEPGEAPPAVP